MKKIDIKYNKFASLLSNLSERKPNDDVEKILHDIIIGLNTPYIEELWLVDDDLFAPISYWIFICNDIIDERESAIIKQLLYWKEFNSKNDAMVKCLQLSDTFFYNLCVKKFKPKFFPALIVSDNPYFEDSIEINSQVLYRLDNKKIISFCNDIHRNFAIGLSISDIRDKIISKTINDYEFDFHKIIKLIEQGLVNRAFDEIYTSCNLSNDAGKQFIMLKYQLIEIEDNNVRGLLHNEEYFRLKNQIVDRFIQFIQTINNNKII